MGKRFRGCRAKRLYLHKDSALHFDAQRLVALREKDKTQEILATENGRDMLIGILDSLGFQLAHSSARSP